MKKIDTSKLSKEEKLRLYDLIQEKKRRIKNRRASYKPNAGQLPIHRSNATLKFCASGNGSGKTCAAVHEAIWAAQGYHPVKKIHTKVPADVSVVLDKPNKSDNVWIPEMKKWFDTDNWQFSKKGRPDTSFIQLPNGSTVTFFSHEQDPLTFESIEIDCAIYDEPPPRSVFMGLRRGTRKKGTKPWHLIIGTPLAGAWLRTEIWEPWSRGEMPETECFRMSSDVNKENINWESQEENFRFMTEREQMIRRQGDFFDLEGQALAHLFDRNVHILSPDTVWDKDNPCVLAIDPHGSKPHVAVLMGVDSDERLYVIKEVTARETPSQFAQTLKDFIKGYRLMDIVCDSYGSNPGKGINHIEAEGFKSFIKVLNENGIRARATTYHEKKDEEFVARIQDALKIPTKADNLGVQLPKMMFFPQAKGCITDVEQVQWTRDKKNDMNKPKLDIMFKDFLACIKYALASNLYYSKSKNKIHKRAIPTTYGGPGKKKKIQSVEEWLKD